MIWITVVRDNRLLTIAIKEKWVLTDIVPGFTKACVSSCAALTGVRVCECGVGAFLGKRFFFNETQCAVLVDGIQGLASECGSQAAENWDTF